MSKNFVVFCFFVAICCLFTSCSSIVTGAKKFGGATYEGATTFAKELTKKELSPIKVEIKDSKGNVLQSSTLEGNLDSILGKLWEIKKLHKEDDTYELYRYGKLISVWYARIKKLDLIIEGYPVKQGQFIYFSAIMSSEKQKK